MLFFMDVLGFYALVYMLIGYFAGKLNTYYIHDDFKLPLAVIAGSDLVLLLVKDPVDQYCGNDNECQEQ